MKFASLDIEKHATLNEKEVSKFRGIKECSPLKLKGMLEELSIEFKNKNLF